ncbi:MAG: SBBP repeat-containing protein [Spirochaetes bacterium]|nr:SBBP repeat-containing protein [Spirochaetota bacterium]
MKKLIIILIYVILISFTLKAQVFDIIEIRNLSNNVKTNIITWNTNILAPTNGWIRANQYIYLHYNKNHTIYTGWGLQIYTDNETNVADPVYIGTGDPAGLVETEQSNDVLLMAWKIANNLMPNVANPTERSDHSGFSDYGWHFMLDKRSATFLNEEDYLVIYNQSGIAWHEAVRQEKPTNAYVYIAAKFDEAMRDKKYRTSMLKVEEYRNPQDPAYLKNHFYIYYNEWQNENPVPNHYTPMLWPGDWSTGSNPDFGWTSDYQSPGTCLKVTFTFSNGGGQGIYWNEPQGVDVSAPGIGYDLTGAKRLTFKIKGDANYLNNELFVSIGNAGDSCGLVQNVDNSGGDRFNVTTDWVQHYIPLLLGGGRNMSHVRVGFNIGAGWKGGSTTTTATVYIDDIRYESAQYTNEGYLWTKRMGGNQLDYGEHMVMDSSRNIYMVGYFRGTNDFGADWGVSDQKISSGYYDIFITKINNNDTYAWTKIIGGSDYYDRGYGVAVDSSGNVYLTGYYSGTVNFQADWGGTDNKTNASPAYYDAFVTKINANGTYGWTKRIGGSQYDSGYAVVCDPSDNVYLTGTFRQTVNFALDWGGTDLKTVLGTEDTFITKINANGTYAWTKRIGGFEPVLDYGLDSDSNGNIYLSGSFQSNVNFADDWGGSDEKNSVGNYDVFITKVNSDGSYGWTKRIGGTEYDKDYGVVTDSSNNIYLTGSFRDTVNFAADWSGSESKTSKGSDDIFLTRINANGTYAWTKRIGGGLLDNGYHLVRDNNGNLYLAGRYTGTVNFAEDWSGEDYKSTTYGEYNAFITKINANGSYGSTKRIGGTGIDWAFAIVADNLGNFYVGGIFSYQVNFAEDWFDVEYKASAGLYDIFLTKFKGW